jgi:hypothetical protein
LVHRPNDDGSRLRRIARRLKLFGGHCLAISENL